MLSNEEVVGATIIECPTWGPIIVQTDDGRVLEIQIDIGHSGPEHNVYERRGR